MTLIEEYFIEKSKQKELEKLQAWKQYYLECNNEWKATVVDMQIARL